MIPRVPGVLLGVALIEEAFEIKDQKIRTFAISPCRGWLTCNFMGCMQQAGWETLKVLLKVPGSMAPEEKHNMENSKIQDD